MIEIAHSIRGRLRIVIRDLRRANDVLAAIVALGAVTRATLNPITGSIVIAYDGAALSADGLWEEICQRIAPVLDASPEVLRCGAPTQPRRIEPLVDAFVDAGLRYLIERSATVLLSAII